MSLEDRQLLVLSLSAWFLGGLLANLRWIGFTLLKTKTQYTISSQVGLLPFWF